MFEIHSRVFFLERIHSSYLNRGALCFSRAPLPSARRCSHSCSAPRPNHFHALHTGTQTSKDQSVPLLPWEPFQPLSALLRSTRSEAISPPPLPPLHPSLILSLHPSSFSQDRRRRTTKNPHPPFSRGMTVPSLFFFLSDSFTHNV